MTTRRLRLTVVLALALVVISPVAAATPHSSDPPFTLSVGWGGWPNLSAPPASENPRIADGDFDTGTTGSARGGPTRTSASAGLSTTAEMTFDAPTSITCVEFKLGSSLNYGLTPGAESAQGYGLSFNGSITLRGVDTDGQSRVLWTGPLEPRIGVIEEHLDHETVCGPWSLTRLALVVSGTASFSAPLPSYYNTVEIKVTLYEIVARTGAADLNGAVKALAYDGGGTLYAGGDFTAAGSTTLNRIARWDGAEWQPLGPAPAPGLNGSALALALSPSGDLYAGGAFAYTAGGSAVAHVARWDGSAWQPLGAGINGPVYAIAFDDASNLYAGGEFTSAGGVPANGIAKWDGSAWSALGGGVGGVDYPYVGALLWDGGQLYAGGRFVTAGGVTVNHIARWDGANWHALGSGVGDGVSYAAVYALLKDATGIVAAGDFPKIAATSVGSVARWNGTSWSGLGAGVNGWIWDLARDAAGNLYAGGQFTSVGGVTANHVAQWNGSGWAALGGGMNAAVHALATNAAGRLYAGGQFTSPAAYVAAWDGSTWSGMGPIVPPDDGMLLIPAGTFQMGCDPANDPWGCRPEESGLHTVYLDAFRIDKYEVTNAQYAQCVAAGGCTSPHSSASATRPSYFGNPDFANYPVIYVDWYQADAYCRWARKHLPTEAEWEKAARGERDTRPYPWGYQWQNCDLVNGWAGGQCRPDTTEVGSYPAGASPYGALDMVGNVREWVNDWWQSDYYAVSPPANPPGPATGTQKVFRGGSWNYWDGINLRVSARAPTGYTPDYGNDTVGIRCAAGAGAQPTVTATPTATATAAATSTATATATATATPPTPQWRLYLPLIVK